LPSSSDNAECATEVKGAGEGAMSLTGFELNTLEIIGQISKNLDTALEGLDEMSLAGFRSQLLEIIEKFAEKRAQPEQKTRHVTGRLNSSTLENDRTMTTASG
jgi:hypothetical protein